MNTATATNTIAAITAEPLNTRPGDTIILTATVLDDAGLPVSGVTVTWVEQRTQVKTEATTDSSGQATQQVTSDTPAVIVYAAFIDDVSTAALTEACFYDANVPPVYVPNGMDGELDKYDIAQQVQVVIDAFSAIRLRDKVVFWWDNIHRYSTEIHSLTDDFPIVIDITDTFPPTCLADGTYELFYQYYDKEGNGGASVPWRVTVTGGGMTPTLPAPTFPEGADGWININEASDGTQLNIAYNDLASNDQLSVTWQVADEQGIQITSINIPYIVTADNVAEGYCLVDIPAEAIPGVQRGSAQAWYVMTPANGDDVQSSAVGKVGVDTVA